MSSIYYQVSDENMEKVEAFFVRQVKEVGSHRFEATIMEIAERSNVALATAHKAIKQLEQEKKVKIIKPSSRRFPITYIYTANIEDFEQNMNEQEQIHYLQEMVQKLKGELSIANSEINRLRSENNILHHSK